MDAMTAMVAANEETRFVMTTVLAEGIRMAAGGRPFYREVSALRAARGTSHGTSSTSHVARDK
jgi:hypothetical protein